MRWKLFGLPPVIIVYTIPSTARAAQARFFRAWEEPRGDENVPVTGNLVPETVSGTIWDNALQVTYTVPVPRSAFSVVD